MPGINWQCDSYTMTVLHIKLIALYHTQGNSFKTRKNFSKITGMTDVNSHAPPCYAKPTSGQHTGISPVRLIIRKT